MIKKANVCWQDDSCCRCCKKLAVYESPPNLEAITVVDALAAQVWEAEQAAPSKRALVHEQSTCGNHDSAVQ